MNHITTFTFFAFLKKPFVYSKFYAERRNPAYCVQIENRTLAIVN